MARDLYETLGVQKTADEDAIRKAFRKLAAKYHPDRNPGKDAEAKFKEVNRAHEVLSDKDKRALYDEFGDASLSQGFDPQRARTMRDFSRGGGGRGGSASFQDVFGGGAGDFGDLFGDLFAGRNGGRPGRPRKAPDMEAEVTVDFVSAIKGTTVELSRPSGDPVQVRIPPGVSDGGRLRIAGEGARIPNAQPGDLLLTVRVGPHPYFRREGDDLHLDLPITVVEAYEGAKVRVPTPEGEVQLKVPPRTQSGQLSRLRGRGVAKKGKPQGDLYVRFLIRIPETDDPAVVRAMEELRQHLQDPRAGIRF
ncbi:MAG: DnaJ domain-containing protein [Polyangiaceae bacterium]|jgi:curved DNA-binding protein|nr:DnaJ domain-containing protein [Polyangiaceae bacterium]